MHIAAAPDDADVVLVAVSRNARRQEPQFYRSTAGGQSWELIASIGSGDMVVAFDWDSSAPERVYAGTDHGKLYWSQDRGLSWELLPVELSSVAVRAMAVGPVS